MSSSTSLTVFITGCSSGIGRALAFEFARQGHRVFATARHTETLADLRELGIAVAPLDVTDIDSIAAAVGAAIAQAGRIDVLINNAGFGLMGPVVELPLDDLRRQLETNVVGAIAVAQAVAPHMIAQGGGRIVNVGSVSGLLATPFAGAYSASKAALHALTDSLRMELAPFGVQVISLQQGGVISRFGEAATQLAAQKIKRDSPYAAMAEAIRTRARAGQRGAMTADEFARRAVAAMTKPRPPRILRLGRHSIDMPLLKWLAPTWLADRISSWQFRLHRLRGRGQSR
jgi:NAD(P)-dependent dehydrogenase (short-subunit alcohol dehydrogenase family)